VIRIKIASTPRDESGCSLGCLSADTVKQMAVCVRCQTDRTVAKKLADERDISSTGEQKGCSTVAQVMQPDWSQASLADQHGESLGHSLRWDRRTVCTGEHEIV
jgi:hypothetical protein